MTSPRSSRTLSWLLATLFILASTGSLALVNVIASETSRRFDVTGLGRHRLSPRASQVLDSLDGRYRLLLAGPWSAPASVQAQQAVPGPRVVQAVFDALAEMARATPSLEVVRIDTASSRGQSQFQEELTALVERDADAIDALRAQIEDALARADAIARTLDAANESLSSAPAAAGATSATRDALLQLAAEARVVASRLREQTAPAIRAADEPIPSLPTTSLDRAAEALSGALLAARTSLEAFAARLEEVAAQPGVASAAADACRQAAARVRTARDAAAVGLEALDRSPVPDAIRVARVLLSGNAAILVGPPERGVLAIGFDLLFAQPTIEQTELGIAPDAGQLAEETLTDALALMTHPGAPTLVFVHGEAQRWVLDTPAIGELQQRLAMKRMTLLEWAPVIEPEPPAALAATLAAGDPVVYVAIGTDSTRVAGVPSEQNGPARADALGRALRDIVDRGDPLLLSIAPSWTAAAFDGDDPTSSFLDRFGLEARPGRTIVTGETTPDGPALEFVHRVLPLEGDHPLIGATAGLPTVVRWPVEIAASPREPSGVVSLERTPLLAIDSDRAWAEKEWLEGWRTARQANASVLTGPGIPRPTPGLDDTEGPWTIAYAAERKLPGRPAQRLVAIGANGWFFDAQTMPGQMQGGRFVRTQPGNLALFESSVYWLANQDDLVAAGATATPVARIKPIAPGLRSALAWGTIAGLPLLVLFAGLIWRVARG
ncbi:MAG: hypothetical protein ACF8SC_02420 [Phycisphaerales bacterium JB037]